MRPINRTTWLLSALALCMVFMSGCAAYKRSDLVASGPGTDFSSDEVAAFRKSQDSLLVELVEAAKPPKELTNAAATGVAVTVPGTTITWDQVIRAGLDYADGRCEAYLHALYRLDRDKKTAVSQTGLIGSATAGVQAAAKAAAKEVAIVAILFGLTSSTIENISSNLLYELEPSSVRTLVKALQSQYRERLSAGYADRPGAMTALRSYAVLCTPANIEAEVNLAVKKTQPESKPGDPKKGQAPVVTNSTIAVSTTTFGPDEASAKLDAFVNPNGKMNAENERKLVAYMTANRVPPQTGTTSFIFGKEYESQRKDAVKHFGLN
jgi:hypothetical protein